MDKRFSRYFTNAAGKFIRSMCAGGAISSPCALLFGQWKSKTSGAVIRQEMVSQIAGVK